MAIGCGYCGKKTTGGRGVCHYCDMLARELDRAWDSEIVECMMEQSIDPESNLMKVAQRKYKRLRCEEVANRLLGKEQSR